MDSPFYFNRKGINYYEIFQCRQSPVSVFVKAFGRDQIEFSVDPVQHSPDHNRRIHGGGHVGSSQDGG